MSNIIIKDPKEQGSVVVIALMILVVLTLLGIMATRTATTDIRIAANEISYKQNFYMAEAAVNREAMEIGRGRYPVINISSAHKLADEDGYVNGDSLPGDAHTFSNVTYEFDVSYEGFFLPPTGYSVIHFSRYDYGVDAQTPAPDTVRVASRYFKIGPKASE
jgi:type IV pilus assembly PilX-like protein